MIAIRMSYHGGRLEGPGWKPLDWRSVEWPPSTSRFLHGLVGAYHRRVGRVSPEQLRRIVGDLSSPPHFLAPDGAGLESPLGASHRPIRFFDAQLSAGPVNDLVWWWPEASLDEADSAALETLLLAMNAFDRQKIWCQARLLEAGDSPLPALPAAPSISARAARSISAPAAPSISAPAAQSISKASAAPSISAPCATSRSAPSAPSISKAPSAPSTSRAPTAPGQASATSYTDLEVRLAGPLPVRVLTEKGSSHAWLERWMAEATRSGAGGEGDRLPALPGLRTQVTAARYRLAGGMMPGLELALPFGERVRRALIYHRSRAGHSRAVTGKEPDGTPLAGHGHAHFLATDDDGDGLIDHVTIYASDGFDAADLEALVRVRSLVGGGDGEVVRLELEALGDAASLREESLFAAARRWRSITPFSLPRFASRGGGKGARPRDLPEAQLRRELALRGLPAPVTVRELKGLELAGGWLPWSRFPGRRKNGTAGHGLTGFELEFAEPIAGPLALGFGCHFGLGVFAPAGDSVGVAAGLAAEMASGVASEGATGMAPGVAVEGASGAEDEMASEVEDEMASGMEDERACAGSPIPS